MTDSDQQALLSRPGSENPHNTGNVLPEDISSESCAVLIGCGKSKRDPTDPGDRDLAVTSEPAWRALDLYTSTYFEFKQRLAQAITSFSGTDVPRFAILSAKHGVVPPWIPLQRYDVSATDLGGDERNPRHHVDIESGRRRPDGMPIVTELDEWSQTVATSLSRWLALISDEHCQPDSASVETLIVLAGQSYLEPLRERGVFQYGISRSLRPTDEQHNPTASQVWCPFEQIDAGGVGEQIAWMKDIIDRIQSGAPDTQDTLHRWVTQDSQSCDRCDVPSPATTLEQVNDELFCQSCRPRTCVLCKSEPCGTGLDAAPLCNSCHTAREQIANNTQRADNRTNHSITDYTQ